MFTEKEFEYFDYINEHRKNLMVAYNFLEEIIDSEYREYMPSLKDLILEHDLSKFSADEFYAYREHFFMDEKESKRKEIRDISVAWEHHYMVNRHHPEGYVEYNERMEPIFLLEMVLDWTAMAIKFNGTPISYYLENEKENFEKNYSRIIDLERLVMLLSVISFQLDKKRAE